MATFLQPPLAARNRLYLMVLAICRISTTHQDERSLADQEASYRRWIESHTDLPSKLTVIASQGSGEALDREEYLRAIELVQSGIYDVVITEDMGRICRRVHAHLFAEDCEDKGTRLIALNDHVDTGREDWRLGSFFAVMRHETYNKDTSQRIRRTLCNRFGQGGVFQFVVYGYVKPAGAKNEMDVYKDPAAGPIYKEWFERLDRGASYAEVADWLNDLGIRPGPYCRKARWTGTMVAGVTHNPILKGLRVRNAKISRRVNKTGRHRSVKAPPEDRLERQVPHLAFFGAAYYDRVIRKLKKRNAKHRRKGENGIDPRANVSKKRTAWPGQHLRCGICGRILHWTGAKDKKIFICSGAESYRCWNSITPNGAVVTQKLTNAILKEILSLPEFDAAFVDLVQQKLQDSHAIQAGMLHELDRQREDVLSQIERLVDSIAEMPSSKALRERLAKLEAKRDDLDDEASGLVQTPPAVIPTPSLDDIKRVARKIFTSFAAQDPEVGRLMHILIPDLRAYPYRLCDDGAVVLRAHFTLNLGALAPGSAGCKELEGVLRRKMTVDLFDPPQRVKYREQVVAMRAEGLTEREISKRLGLTLTAVQRAAALDRRMRAKDITDPYQPISEPPQDYGKLCRHWHPRYRFEPLDGAAS